MTIPSDNVNGREEAIKMLDNLPPLEPGQLYVIWNRGNLAPHFFPNKSEATSWINEGTFRVQRCEV